MLGGDNNSVSSGGRALIPHKGSLEEAVELRELERSSLLLLREIVLGARSRAGPTDL
jgi:hypothetical protein